MKIHQSMACRIHLFAAYRNRTCRVRPDALVTGASPVSANSMFTAGNLSQSSPISAINAAATTGPIPGNEEDRRIRMFSEEPLGLGVERPQVIGVHPQFLGEQLRGERLPAVVPGLAPSRCGRSRSTKTCGFVRPE